MNFDNLYKLAFEFKKRKIWNTIHESEIFAVKLSDGRIGYITVTGQSKTVFMVALYIGEEALQGLLNMFYETFIFLSNFEQQELMLSQNCLQCALESKDDLDPDTIEITKKYAKKHKIKLTGRNSYPVFLKYSPFSIPWDIVSEEDTIALEEALSAVMRMADLVEERGKEKLGLKSISKRTKKIPMLEIKNNEFILTKTDLPKRSPRKYYVPECSNELMIEKIKNYNNKVTLECELVRELKPTFDQEVKRPVFPVMLFAVNERSSFSLPVEKILGFERNPDKLMNSFIAGLDKYEIMPSRILALNNYTYHFFKPFCEKMGIEVLFKEDSSDYMDEVQGEFFDEEIDLAEKEEEELEGLIDSLIGFSQGEISKDQLLERISSLGLEPPDEIMQQLSEIEEDIMDRKNNNNGIINLFDEDLDDDDDDDDDDIDIDLMYVISVSLLKGCYRHIKIPGSCTLDELHLAINDAFGFDDDHLHAFFMDNRLWSSAECYYDYRSDNDGIETDSIDLDDLELQIGDKFKYVYDFGDQWVFQCKVIKRYEEEHSNIQVIKSVGDAPPQYSFFTDDDDGYAETDNGILPQ